MPSVKKYNPIEARKYSLDLVPAGAYWRPLLGPENHVDFASVEAAEGIWVTGSRLRLGLILLGQMQAVLAYVRSARFTPAGTVSYRLPLMKEIEREMLRVQAKAFQVGAESLTGTSKRALIAHGRRPEAPPVQIKPGTVNKWKAMAAKEARALERYIFDPLSAVFSDAWDHRGGLKIKPMDLEAQVRAVYAGFLDMDPEMGPQVVEFADPATVEDWIRVGASDIRARGDSLPVLKPNPTKDYVLTAGKRAEVQGIWEGGLASPVITGFQYSAIMDARTCERCIARDGVIRDKNDDWWVFNMPPLHRRCRCRPVPVIADEVGPETPKSILDSIDASELPPGYGGVAPDAFQGLPTIIRSHVPGSLTTAQRATALGLTGLRDSTIPTSPQEIPGLQFVPSGGAGWRMGATGRLVPDPGLKALMDRAMVTREGAVVSTVDASQLAISATRLNRAEVRRILSDLGYGVEVDPVAVFPGGPPWVVWPGSEEVATAYVMAGAKRVPVLRLREWRGE